MSDLAELDPQMSDALDVWARTAMAEVADRADVIGASMTGTDELSVAVANPVHPLRRRRRVMVAVGVAAAVIAVVVGIAVIPSTTRVDLRPSQSGPSELPGRGENIATAHVAPAWWPSDLRSPIEAGGIGSRLEQQSWLIRRAGVVVATASLEQSELGDTRESVGGRVSWTNTDPSFGVSVDVQVRPRVILQLTSLVLTADDLDGLAIGFDAAPATFTPDPATGLTVAENPDGWMVAGQLDGFVTAVSRWSGRPEDSRQLVVGGRAVADAAGLVEAIGQYHPGSLSRPIGSTAGVMVRDGSTTAVYWPIAPTVLGVATGLDIADADLIHTATSTTAVPRSTWEAIRRRPITSQEVSGFEIPDTEAYVNTGDFHPYRWLLTRGLDGFRLTYTNEQRHVLLAESRIDGYVPSHQGDGQLGVFGDGHFWAVDMLVPHGPTDAVATLNGESIPLAVVPLPGTPTDLVVTISKLPAGTRRLAGHISPSPGKVVVTANYADGSTFTATT